MVERSGEDGEVEEVERGLDWGSFRSVCARVLVVRFWVRRLHIWVLHRGWILGEALLNFLDMALRTGLAYGV